MTSNFPLPRLSLAFTRVAILVLLSGSPCLLSAAPDPYLIEIKKLTSSEAETNDEFGFEVAISGNTAVVGEFPHNGSPASAYLYERDAGGTNNWAQVKKFAGSGSSTGHGNFTSVAISGDTVVVSGTGATAPEAQIFERNAGGPENWGLVKVLNPYESADNWGVSIAISGNTLVIGAGGAERRAAYVYERNEGGANNWGLVKPRLLASDTMPVDFFGIAVAIAGDTIVVGAPGGRFKTDAFEQAGAAYVFERNAGGTNNWGEVRKLAASDGGRNDQFGISVDVDGDVIAVGAHQDDIGAAVDQGSAYLFERNLGGAGNWGVAKKLTASDGESRNRFGTSIAVSGNKVVVGENENTPRQIKIFERNQGGANNWGEFQKLNPTGSSNAIFGYSVDIDGGTVIVGAPWDNVAGNALQGSAYIFDSVTGPNPTIRGQTLAVAAGQVVGGTIAAVSDDVTPPGNLVVTATSLPDGISVSNISNEYGRVTASVSVGCSVPAGSHAVGLTVTDANGLSATANMTVNVRANAAPTLGNYAATRVSLGGSLALTPSAAPSDDSFQILSLSAAAPGFSGSLSIASNGVVSISNAGSPGDYTVTVTATDQCGASTARTFTLTVLPQTGLITVNTAADVTANDGACSLREAIVAANNNTASGALAGECVAGLSGTDTIAFNIPGGGPHTIVVGSSLPAITEPVIIDGLTQPGANGSIWPPTLKIGLNGSNAGAGANGLHFGVNALFSTVRGLAINGFGGAGVHSFASNTTIQGNFIGTDFTGTVALGNGTGVDLKSNGGNLLGGGASGARNLISGNHGAGIAAQPGAGGNKVQGNFIGTDVTGTLDLGNQGNGITLNTAGPKFSSLLIGGPGAQFRNVISGNDQQGVFVQLDGGSVTLQGNFIGTDVTGTQRLGNSANGIWVSFASSNVTIGGNESARNVISANGAAGVKLGGIAVVGCFLVGNYIGTDASGGSDLGNGQDGVFIGGDDFTSGNQVGFLVRTGPIVSFGTGGNLVAFNVRDGVRVEGNSRRNSIGYNSIINNGGLSINLGADETTPNDPGDTDTGPNGLQNFPILTSALTNGNRTTIEGTLNSKPNSEFTIQFFSSAACGASGKPEGRVFLSENGVTTDANGNAPINVSLPVGITPGNVVTATATLTTSADPDQFSTSELSPCQVIDGIGASPADQLLNIATRLRVQTGENVLIGGFIITGTEPKKIMIRAIGPSLASLFNGVLEDPVLELFQGSTLLEANDNWKNGDRPAIEATGIPPSHDLEAAIVRTLVPGAYTAIVRGKTGPGIGLVEAYDLNQAANSKLANISTRGFVEGGNNLMIGGFIIGGPGGGGATVIVRAVGPSLGNFGIVDSLQDPTLDLVDANGTVLRANNDWKESQQTEIEAAGLSLSDSRESAIVQTLAPGNYTAIVRGRNQETGVGLVEVYNVQ